MRVFEPCRNRSRVRSNGDRYTIPLHDRRSRVDRCACLTVKDLHDRSRYLVTLAELR